MKIHLIDVSKLPAGAWPAFNTGMAYATEEMDILPRKDDTIVLYSPRQPISFPKENHTVWSVWIHVDHGVREIYSVGYRYIL
jgi:hypothetical protein